MPALIKAAEEKQRELDKAAAAAAARARALEERAKAAEERRRAAAEAQRKAELEAAAAVEAEVEDTLRRLEEDAKKAESAAEVGRVLHGLGFYFHRLCAFVPRLVCTDSCVCSQTCVLLHVEELLMLRLTERA